jgi:parallel beta-helix repeat protein
MKKTLSGLMLTLLLLSMLMLTFNVQLVKAEPTTIIVPDDYRFIQEAINAAKAGDTIYVRAGVYYEALVVNKSITIMGQDRETTIIDALDVDYVICMETNNVSLTGFTIRNAKYGIHIPRRDFNIIYGNIITDTQRAVFIENGGDWNIISANMIINNAVGVYILVNEYRATGNYNVISENLIINNNRGIELSAEYIGSVIYNKISKNIIGNNTQGIALFQSYYGSCAYNEISENIIMDNERGIYFSQTSDNKIFHNDFIKNAKQVGIWDAANIWNDDYPSGGNYWSDYTGLDEKSGPNQNVIGSDGIGDTPYPIDGKNKDAYPLVIPRHAIPIIWDEVIYPVEMKSNSTISTLQFNQSQKQISFYAIGPSGTHGFCNITIPKALLKGEPWTVKLNGTGWAFSVTENETHSFIYFTYIFESTYEVIVEGTWVVPEFPSITVLPLLMLIMLITTLILRKRKNKPNFHSFSDL